MPRTFEGGIGGGSGGSGTDLTIQVTQVGHGLAFGDVIKSNGSANSYARAQADSPANAEAVGVVTAVIGVNDFSYTSSAIQLSGAFVPVGTPGSAVFLDPTTPGAMTTVKPTTVGQVVRALGTVLISGGMMYFDIAALGEEITGSSSGTDAELKVGVGSSDDINWFNIQYPLYKDNGADNEYSFWELVGSPTITSLSFTAFGASDAIIENTASNYTALLPDLDVTNGECKFNTSKQVIFQQLVKTFSSPGTNEGGCGFNPPGTLYIYESQGTNAITVGFVRSTAGQWYARTGNGASFTETAITVTDDKHVFRCEYDPANVTPQARYYVDGILLATITTTLPTASSANISFACGSAAGEVAFDVICAPSFAVEI